MKRLLCAVFFMVTVFGICCAETNIKIIVSGPQGRPGDGIAPGGSPGQILCKTALGNYSTGWCDGGTGSGPGDLSGLVPKTTTVNGHALNGNVSVTVLDIGAATAAQGAKADTALQPGYRDPGFLNYSGHDHTRGVITTEMTGNTSWWQSIKANLKTYFDSLYHGMTVTWSEITGKPTTVATSGITDAKTTTAFTLYSTHRAGENVVNRFINFSTHHATGGGGSGPSLTTASGYPGARASDTTAATPAYVDKVFRTYTTGSRDATYTDVTGLWSTCTSGYLKFDGTCSTPSSGGAVGSLPFLNLSSGMRSSLAGKQPLLTNPIVAGAIGSAGQTCTFSGTTNTINCNTTPTVYQANLGLASLSGDTTKAGTVSGTFTANDCLKMDASGNIVTAGGACTTGGGGGTVSSGTTGQFAYYGSNGTVVAGRTLIAGDIPSLSGTYLPLSGGTMTGNLNMGSKTIYGDTASGGNLTIQSTSHATKGKILFGTSAYDEVNNRLGIGTTTPNSLLEMSGPSAIITANSTTSNPSGFIFTRNSRQPRIRFLSYYDDTSGVLSYLTYNTQFSNVWTQDVATKDSISMALGNYASFGPSASWSVAGQQAGDNAITGIFGISTKDLSFRVGVFTAGEVNTDLGHQVFIRPRLTTQNALGIKGIASFTGNYVNVIDSSGNALFNILSNGNVGIGTTTPYGKLSVGVVPTASANHGTLSLGGGAFDGSTTGKFIGSSSGTSIAANEVSGYAGNLMDLQVAGVSKFSVSSQGDMTLAGNTLSFGGNLTTSGAYATTLTATGATNITLPTSGTLATTGNLSQFAATTSAQLAGVLSDETGTGSAVFGTSPTLTTPDIAGATSSTTTNTALASTTINLDGVVYADFNYSNGTTAASYTTGFTSRPASGKVRYITLTLNPTKASGVITMTWTGVTWMGTAGAGATTASKASTYACMVGNSTTYCAIIGEAY